MFIAGCGNITPKVVDYAKTDEVAKSKMAEESAANSETIHMNNGFFDKSSVTVKKGGAVVWVNDDTKPYFFIIYHKEFSDGDYQIKKVPSGPIEPGQKFSFTFEQTGEYKIVPIWRGRLRGVVQVIE